MHTPKRSLSTRRVASVADLPTSGARLPVADEEDASFQPIPVDQWAQDPVLMSGCEPHGPRLNVAVLLSGGVDSSLALRLLVAAGHRCKAFYLQIWFQEDFRNFWDACPWEEDLRYAQQVCDAVGVELEVVPLTQAYWDSVVSHSVAQIRAGRTPNPDMLCNSRVKFGAFVDYLQSKGALAPLDSDGEAVGSASSSSNGSGSIARFDRVASGHYARVVRDSSEPHAQNGAGRVHTAEAAAAISGAQQANSGSLASSTSSPSNLQPAPASASAPTPPAHYTSSSTTTSSTVRLSLSADSVKDQSYFLAQLSPRQLARVMFPLGALTKTQVRQLAISAGLATQARKDSQGICFLGKVKFPEFVREHLGEWPGLIVVDSAYDASVQQQQQQQQQVQQEHLGESTQGSEGPQGAGSSVPSNTNSSSQEKGADSAQPPTRSTHHQPRTRRKQQRIEGSGSGSGGAVNVVASFGGALVLGIHQGYWFYTVGQRGGIKLPGGPWYVTRKDPDLNIVYVSRRYEGSALQHSTGTGSGSIPANSPLAQPHTAFITAPFNWLSDVRPDQADDAPPLFCKVRHGPHAYRCSIVPLSATAATAQDQSGSVSPPPHTADHTDDHDASPMVVVLWGRDQGVAPGQFAVLYQAGQCLGAAQIESLVAKELEPSYLDSRIRLPSQLEHSQGGGVGGKADSSGAVVLTTGM